MYYFNRAISLLVTLLGAFGQIDSFQRPCEDLSQECLMRSLQSGLPGFVQGLPTFGVETLDPYSIDKLNLVLPGGINVQFTHGIAKGLKSCIVDLARLSGNTLETQFHCNLTIKGAYRSVGRLLMFHINGDGESIIKCNNLKIHSFLKLRSKIENDGWKYLQIIGSDTKHSYDGRVSYSMTNLFKGNPEISKAVLDFMNNNWRMVAEEFGGPLVDYGVAATMRNIKRFLKKVPLDQIVTAPINF